MLLLSCLKLSLSHCQPLKYSFVNSTVKTKEEIPCIFVNIISLWPPLKEHNPLLSLLLKKTFVTFHFYRNPPPLSGKAEFMSPCISPRQTDGYTRRPRRTYTARQSDCSFYATLFMLYSIMLDSEAFFFSCAHYCSVSLLSPLFLTGFTYFSIALLHVI